MLPYEPVPGDDPGAYRSVPSHNLVRILSGEMPAPGAQRAEAQHAKARAAALAAHRFKGWQRLLHALGLYG